VHRPGNVTLNLAEASKWLPRTRWSGSGAKVICFPPAGAGAGFFRDWGSELPNNTIVPVQLPGREERFGEALIDNARDISKAISNAIKVERLGSVILLGYSFGSLLAFETAKLLEGSPGGCRVLGVVSCARAAPQISPLETAANKSDKDLLQYIRQLGGLPPELNAEPEFLKLLLPILRADLRANDIYAASNNDTINAPIASVVGSDDSATRGSRAKDWAKYTISKHQIFSVPGAHFFINGPASKNCRFGAISRAINFVANSNADDGGEEKL
jgi:surfactin synthase thioesterase subunit